MYDHIINILNIPHDSNNHECYLCISSKGQLGSSGINYQFNDVTLMYITETVIIKI